MRRSLYARAEQKKHNNDEQNSGTFRFVEKGYNFRG